METIRQQRKSIRAISVLLLTGSVLTGCEQQATANPSARIENTNHAPSVSMKMPTAEQRLEQAWAESLHDYPGAIDIALYNYATGETAHYTNAPGTKFVTASTVKLSILEKVLLDNQAAGRSMTTTQATNALPMIATSDNAAASRLWEEAGSGNGMQEFFDRIGATTTSANTYGAWGVTETTALDQLHVARQVAGGPESILGPGAIAAANNLLDQVVPEQRWGVPAGVPQSAIARVKNGWLDDTSAGNQFAGTSSWTNNSVGYVEGEIYGKKIKYALAEFSSGNVNVRSGQQLLSDLAATAWNAISLFSAS